LLYRLPHGPQVNEMGWSLDERCARVRGHDLAAGVEARHRGESQAFGGHPTVSHHRIGTSNQEAADDLDMAIEGGPAQRAVKVVMKVGPASAAALTRMASPPPARLWT